MARIAEVIKIDHNVNFALQDVLSTMLSRSGNSSVYPNIVDHGCWCGRMNPINNRKILGGTTTVDELDEICKSWFNTRFCNDALSGGQCQDVSNDSQYDLLITTDGKLECDYAFTDKTCDSSSCAIDVHYSNLISDYIAQNEITWNNVNNEGICDRTTPTNDLEKICVGVAPNLSIETVVPPIVSEPTVYEIDLNDNYELTFTFKITNLDFGEPWATIARVMNTADNGYTNTEYTRYPALLFNKSRRKIEVSFVPCDEPGFNNAFSNNLIFFLNPVIEIGVSYTISIVKVPKGWNESYPVSKAATLSLTDNSSGIVLDERSVMLSDTSFLQTDYVCSDSRRVMLDFGEAKFYKQVYTENDWIEYSQVVFKNTR